jgi:hypothetical protein
MSEESEIFKAATRLIEQHGEAAAAVAARHMAALKEHNDRYNAAHWARIIAMIEKLQRETQSDASDLP